jgi:microcompartment protein CcmK/EutM
MLNNSKLLLLEMAGQGHFEDRGRKLIGSKAIGFGPELDLVRGMNARSGFESQTSGML